MDRKMEKFLVRDKYWLSLATALYHGGMESCLNLLHNNSNNPLPKLKKSLYICLVKQKTFLYSLLKHGILRYDEWDLLFSKEEETDSSKFDLGMTIALLQAICLPSPKRGWVNLEKGDHSVSSCVVKLRLFKDKLNDYVKIDQITFDEYSSLWKLLCEILQGLNYDVSKVHELYIDKSEETLKYYLTGNVKFTDSIRRAEVFYVLKTFHDVKICKEKHLNNVRTVISVVDILDTAKINREALRLEELISKLENGIYREKNNGFQNSYKILKTCANSFNVIERNEKRLDAIIQNYNKNIHDSEKAISKNDIEKASQNSKRKASNTYFTFKKSYSVGWLRRNTLRDVSRDIPKVSIEGEAKTYQKNSDFFRKIDMGDY